METNPLPMAADQERMGAGFGPPPGGGGDGEGSKDDEKRFTGRMIAMALGVLLVMSAVLVGANALADRYAQARAAEDRLTTMKHCGQLAGALSAKTETIVGTQQHGVLLKAFESCFRKLADQTSFTEAMVQKTAAAEKQTEEVATGGLLAFFLAPESAGNLLYKMVLALVYTSVFASLVIVLLGVVESRFVTGKSVSAAMDALRTWITGESGGGKTASALASLVAPVALAAPIALGATLAIRADPVDLKLAASEVALRIRPEIKDLGEREVTIKRMLDIEVVPRIAGAASAIPVQVSIQPVVEKKKVDVVIAVPTPGGPVPQGTQTISISMPALEQRLGESITEQRTYNATFDAYLKSALPVVATMTGAAEAIRELNQTQQGHLKQLRDMNGNLDGIARGERASVKADSLVDTASAGMRR